LQILDIHLFVLGGFLSTKTHQGDFDPVSESIGMNYTPLKVDEVVASEMKQRKGRTVISSKYGLNNTSASANNSVVCVDDDMSDKIRRLVQNITDDTVFLKELDFRPSKGGPVSLYDPEAE